MAANSSPACVMPNHPKFSSWGYTPVNFYRCFTLCRLVRCQLFNQSASPIGLVISKLFRHYYRLSIISLCEIYLTPTAEFRIMLQDLLHQVPFQPYRVHKEPIYFLLKHPTKSHNV